MASENNHLKNVQQSGLRRQDSSHFIFKQLTRTDAEKALNSEIAKLIASAPESHRSNLSEDLDNYSELFHRYLDDQNKQIDWKKIEVLNDEHLKHYSNLTKPSSKEERRALLDKLVVIKLNGGLGTTMGCTGTKSLISVRNDLTFLDLNIQQIERLNNKYNCSIPLVLMNSFNTNDDTQRVMRKYQFVNVKIHSFVQSRFPRINRESLLPLPQCFDPSKEDTEDWYPPGHGDIYRSFVKSGLCEEFLKQGKEWIFVSNIDNLAATVSVEILQFLHESKAEFVMEVTEKTRADVKGGTLIEYENKLRLLEIAQVPKENVDEFTSVRKFRIFNTNNIWISIPAIKKHIENDAIHMEIIVNPKTLENGTTVLQLEEAVGAAIKSFDGAVGLKVPRTRFLPVKTTSDLLLLMSNLYQLKSGKVVMNKARNFSYVPLIKLGTQFKKVQSFLSRFENIPNLLELDHLTVSGDVTFGKNVQLRGTVIIIANHGDRIDIPPGAILENKIVSGNLRILDH